MVSMCNNYKKRTWNWNWKVDTHCVWVTDDIRDATTFPPTSLTTTATHDTATTDTRIWTKTILLRTIPIKDIEFGYEHCREKNGMMWDISTQQSKSNEYTFALTPPVTDKFSLPNKITIDILRFKVWLVAANERTTTRLLLFVSGNNIFVTIFFR